MTDFVLATADPETMLSHLALYGLAAIAEEGGVEDVRLSWSGGMMPRPVLSAPQATPETLGEIVRQHAGRHDAPESWPSRQVSDGEKRALMSPRISVITTGDGWHMSACRSCCCPASRRPSKTCPPCSSASPWPIRCGTSSRSCTVCF